jgi:hypothetical protein
MCCISTSKLLTYSPPLFLAGVASIPSLSCTCNNKMAKKKKEKKCHFPTNPRYGVRINPTPNDLQALGDRQMLNSRLLDCLLQRSAPPPNEDTPFQVYLGSLETTSHLVFATLWYTMRANLFNLPTGTGSKPRSKGFSQLLLIFFLTPMMMMPPRLLLFQLSMQCISLCLWWNSISHAENCFCVLNTTIRYDALHEKDLG